MNHLALQLLKHLARGISDHHRKLWCQSLAHVAVIDSDVNSDELLTAMIEWADKKRTTNVRRPVEIYP